MYFILLSTILNSVQHSSPSNPTWENWFIFLAGLDNNPFALGQICHTVIQSELVTNLCNLLCEVNSFSGPLLGYKSPRYSTEVDVLQRCVHYLHQKSTNVTTNFFKISHAWMKYSKPEISNLGGNGELYVTFFFFKDRIHCLVWGGKNIYV